MFSILSFTVLVIGAIGANNFEIRHSIELESSDVEGINVNEVSKDVKDELHQLICTEYDELVNACSIEGMVKSKMAFEKVWVSNSFSVF